MSTGISYLDTLEEEFILEEEAEEMSSAGATRAGIRARRSGQCRRLLRLYERRQLEQQARNVPTARTTCNSWS